MIVAGLCEALLLTSFLFFLSAISNINELLNSDFIQILNNFYIVNSERELKIILAITFIVTLVFSSLIRLFNFKYTYKFSSLVGTDFSYKSFRNKLYQNYSSFLKEFKQFISLLTVFITEMCLLLRDFTHHILNLYFNFCLSLYYINFKLTSVIFILILLVYQLIGKLVVKQLNSNSKMEIALDREKMFIIRDGISAIREILINNSQEYFLKGYHSSEAKLQTIRAQNKYISVFPKTILEAFGLTIVSIIVLILSSMLMEKKHIFQLLEPLL